MIIGNYIGIGNYGGGAQASQATAPSPLMAWSKDTTSAAGQFNDPGADNYVVQGGDQSDYSDAVEVQSSSSTSFSESGLTAGQVRYYRVKAQKTGYADSDWVNASVTTIMVMPDFWYELTGLKTGVDNEYGTTDNTTPSRVDTILPIINTSALTLTAGATEGTVYYNDFTSPYNTFRGNSTNWYTAPSTYTFVGDFTFFFRLRTTQNFVNNQIVGNSANAGYYIRFSNNTSIQININGSFKTVTIPSIVLNPWYDIGMKRVGSTFYVSLDGGQTFPYSVASVSTSDFIFDRMFISTIAMYQQRTVGWSGEQSAAVIAQARDYLKQPTYTEADAVTPVVTGVTWSAHSGDYIVNTSFAKNVIASWIRDRIINIGDYRIICGNTKTTSPDYSNDFVIIEKRSTGEMSDIKYLGVPRNIVDDHNNGSIFKEDNRIKHAEMDSHYDSGTPQPTSLLIKEFGNKFDFTSFIQRTLANGVASFTNSTTQYYLYHRFSETKKAFLFQYWVGGASFGQYTGILISDDNLNSYRKELIIDVGTTNWVYHNMVYSPDGVPRVFFAVENEAGGARDGLFDYLFYMENPSKDGVTWVNKAGDFSQDISGFNPVSLANAIAHCLVQDASASAAGNAKIQWAFYDDSDGEIHGIISDGDDTGMVMLYSVGGTWTTQAIDAGTKTLIYDFRTGNGDNSPILIRTGTNSYDAYVHEDNGGAWKIIKKSTTDKGVTWTNGTDFSSDDTAQHKRMHVNRDALYNDYITIGAARVVSADNSDIFRKDV